uniref:Uncharacterized protein n=1 Tax=Rhizophora mucronata TaxID=61149 RepID=A0A2P2Q1C1_RHIMU
MAMQQKKQQVASQWTSCGHRSQRNHQKQ